ncbi:MAG: phage holin family protein [Anaerolineae bacterium]|nr:phage holin family protein [Thermoflexus sp.]MDW8064219.1 phage holin family protein [Anaerolineae bacterium]
MRSFLIRWVLNTIALWLVSQLYDGVSFRAGAGLSDLLLAGLVLGLANALIRPILLFITLPLTLLTLGLFTFIVNAVILYLVAALTALEVRGFLAALIGAVLLSIVSFGLSLLVRDKS